MSAMPPRREKNKKASGNQTKSDDPVDLDRRIFVGNLPSNWMTRGEFELMFSKYGKITAVSMFRGFGFVQFERTDDADAAIKGEHGRFLQGYRLDINKAAERRKMNKGPSRSSPSRRDLYGYGEGQEPRHDRSRSPLHSSPRRGSREPRDGRDSRAVRDVRDGRDPRDVRDSRDLRDSRNLDIRDVRDGRERDFRDSRDARDIRDPREIRDARDIRDPRDTRDNRDLRDARDPRDSREYRDLRDTRELRDDRDLRVRDARDVRDPLFERYKEARDPRDPLYRVDYVADKYRLDDLNRKKDDLYDRFRDPLDRLPEDRLKREERRREELYRQYFDEIQRRMDAERAVDCSVVVVNKQSKEYAESVGRKVRDLGMMVDLIFLNTEVSLTQALEDVSRGGSPFAIVITQQHQAHDSCTVNLLFGTPQEHRNMPLADAMLLVARSYERYKTESREKEREDIARQAAKLSAEAILKERGILDEGVRGGHPPGIMTLLGLLADNRYVTSEEIDKVILYLQQRKERILTLTSDSLTSQLSRQTGAAQATSLDAQSTLGGSQTLQLTQQLSSATVPPQGLSNSQQELQAKILSLFNSGASTTSNPGSSAVSAVPSQNYGGMSNTQRSGPSMDAGILGPAPRSQPTATILPNAMAAGAAVRSAAPRPGPSPQMQSLYGQLSNRVQVPGNVPGQRLGVSSGINFDNPSVQKALDTLIQSGPALSHLVGQAAGPALRGGPPQQSNMVSFPRHF